MRQHISDFPSLTSCEFTSICHSFLESQELLESLGHSYNPGGGRWKLKKAELPWGQGTSTFLELRQQHPQDPIDDPPYLDSDSDVDPESLPPKSKQSGVEVVYNILYSPTYRVPVLYFTGATPVQVAGTVSQGEHLLTGEIWWFVHPCATGEAMKEWESAVSDGEWGRYLGIWLGLVGAAAGLQ